MDLGPAGISLTLLGLEAAFYFWHEPQIDQLERRRLARLQDQIAQLFNGATEASPCEERVFSYLSKAFERDRLLLMPVGTITPHRKIFFILLACLALSVFYTIFERAWDPVITQNFLLLSSPFTLSTLLALISAVGWVIAAYMGAIEFRYVLRIRSLFTPSLTTNAVKSLPNEVA